MSDTCLYWYLHFENMETRSAKNFEAMKQETGQQNTSRSWRILKAEVFEEMVENQRMPVVLGGNI